MKIKVYLEGNCVSFYNEITYQNDIKEQDTELP